MGEWASMKSIHLISSNWRQFTVEQIKHLDWLEHLEVKRVLVQQMPPYLLELFSVIAIEKWQIWESLLVLTRMSGDEHSLGLPMHSIFSNFKSVVIRKL